MGDFERRSRSGAIALVLVVVASCGDGDEGGSRDASVSSATRGDDASAVDGTEDAPDSQGSEGPASLDGSAASTDSGAMDEAGGEGSSDDAGSSDDMDAGAGMDAGEPGASVDAGEAGAAIDGSSDSDASDGALDSGGSADASDGSSDADGSSVTEAGSDGAADASGDADGASGPSSCVLLGTLISAQALRQGCTDDSAQIRELCEELSAAGRCVSELDALARCAAQVPDTGWVCEANGGAVWFTQCEAEQSAYDTCFRTVCTPITNAAPAIDVVQVARSLPAGAGGPISDGTYYQTKYEKFTGPGGAEGSLGLAHKQTIVISGAASGTATAQSVTANGDDPELHEVFTLTASESSVTVTRQCPTSSEPVTLPFTVSGGDFAFVSPVDGVVETFTRQ